MSFEIDVKVVPRSSQERIEPLPDGSLKIWVRAAPADGQANESVCKILCRALRIPKSSVEIVRGQTSRQKRIRAEGIEPSEARKRLS
jgi:uncharacterized protein (TIGR00251 family)